MSGRQACWIRQGPPACRRGRHGCQLRREGDAARVGSESARHGSALGPAQARRLLLLGLACPLAAAHVESSTAISISISTSPSHPPTLTLHKPQHSHQHTCRSTRAAAHMPQHTRKPAPAPATHPNSLCTNQSAVLVVSSTRRWMPLFRASCSTQSSRLSPRPVPLNWGSTQNAPSSATDTPAR